MRYRFSPVRWPAVLGVVLPSMGLVAGADGGTFLWNNTSGSWTVGSNWVGGVAPTGAGLSDVLVFGGDVGTVAGTPPNYAAVNDAAGGFGLNGLRFDATDLAGLSTDPPLNLTGSLVRCGGAAPFVEQLNAGAVTLDCELASDSDLLLRGDGAGVVTLNGALSGAFDITKSGASTFRFGTPAPVPPALGRPSENTWMGRLILNGGIMRFNNNAYSGPTALRANPVRLTGAGSTLTCSSELRTGTLEGGAGLVQSQVTGTNTASENLVVQSLQPGSFGGTVRLGPPTGTGGAGGTFIVRGPGVQTLTGTLDINKDVAVAGQLTLAGTASLGSQASGSIGMAGGTLKLDNSATPSNNRVRDGSATSTGLEPLGGGTFQLIGHSSGTMENAGRLQLGSASKPRSGQLTIEVVHAAAAAPTVLAFASVNRDTTTVAQTATVNFSATDPAGTPLALGSPGHTPRITIGSALVSNGLLANSAGSGANGWATVNGTDFATHGANGIAAAPTTAWPAVSSPSANVAITGSVSTPVSTFALNSLKIAPSAPGQTLSIAAGRTFDCPAILLAGTTDYAISGAGALAGTGTHYVHVTGAVLSIASPLPNSVCVKAGSGVLAATAAANAGNTQVFALEGGALRGQQGVSLPGGEIKFRGGVLELTGGGTFSRSIGFTAGTVNWSGFDTAFTPPVAISEDRGSGGFAAVGADVAIDLNGTGPTTVVWESPGFVQSNFALVLGSPRADHRVTLVDGLQLNSDETTVKYSPREIRVVDNPASASDDAVISGVLSGTKHNDLLKTGAGTLELSAVNTLAGAVLVQGGTLNLSGSLPNSLATGVLSGATLTGGGSASRLLLGSGGTVAPGTGGVGTLSAAGCVWRAGGLMRFELASASNSSDRLALGTAALQKGDAAGPFAFDFGGTGANGFTYTLATFGSTTFSPSDFTATGLPPQVAGTFQISGGNTLQFVTGAPIEFWRRSWFGPSAVNAGSSANGADPDSDGLSNLEEYALGSSPLAATASAGPVSADGAGRLAMVFSRNPAATDVTLRIESSTTLAAASWTPEAVWSQAAGWTVAPGAHISENAGVVTFTDSVLLSSQAAGRRCLRLRVSQP